MKWQTSTNTDADLFGIDPNSTRIVDRLELKRRALVLFFRNLNRPSVPERLIELESFADA